MAREAQCALAEKVTLARRVYDNGDEGKLVLIISIQNNRHCKRRVVVDETLEGLAAQISWMNFSTISLEDVGSLETITGHPENLFTDYPIDVSEVRDFYSAYLKALKK